MHCIRLMLSRRSIDTRHLQASYGTLRDVVSVQLRGITGQQGLQNIVPAGSTLSYQSKYNACNAPCRLIDLRARVADAKSDDRHHHLRLCLSLQQLQLGPCARVVPHVAMRIFYVCPEHRWEKSQRHPIQRDLRSRVQPPGAPPAVTKKAP